MVGKTVGKYRVVERIGRGGMGIVYKAVDETLDRDVAIKVLNAEFGDAAVLKRFRAEAVTLARLSHSGIATIYELHHQDDELMMVMEFVRGETLHQLSERMGPLDPPQAAHLCMQVLDALSHAHRTGVIHRDLKPANLMVTDTGVVKVMDFGIARVLGTETFTLGGLTMGTPAYMAPEQVTGQSIDARADLYAIGVVFYRLLTGRLPFEADTAIAMAQKHVSEQPTPLSEIRPDLPGWCAAIVDRALAKDPARRFQSADEFRVALASAVVPKSIGELPTLATPTLGTALAPTTILRAREAALDSKGAAPVTTPTGAERANTTVVLGRSHVLVLAVLFVTLAAGIVVLAIAAFRTGQQSPPSVPSEVAAPQPGGDMPKTDGVPPADAPAAPKTPAPADSLAAFSPPQKVEPRNVPKPPASSPASSGSASTSKAAPTVAPPSPATDEPPRATPELPATPAQLPAVAFGGVRLLVVDGDRSRDRRGVLRIADGELMMVDGNASRSVTSLSAITGIHYSRSKQPRWKDETGKEVATRADLGRFSFFRGDRNWLILTTSGEPVILSVDDPQVGTITRALEARTGLSTRRFQ